MTSSAVTPAAKRVALAVRRANIVSGAAEAAVDVRKACNGIKRMSALAAVTAAWERDPKRMVRAAEDMALGVLTAIGFDVSNEQRVASVLPIVLEASSVVLSEALRSGSTDSLEELVLGGIEAMSAVAKSRAVVKAVEPLWPTDMDAVTTMRITAAASMACVAVEVDAFDFMHPPAECIKEVTKYLVKLSTDAARQLAPPQSSPAARLMLTQTLMQSSARLYASVWRGQAQLLSSELDALPDSAREVRLTSMEASPLNALVAPINDRFEMLFNAVNAAAMQSFQPLSEEAPAPARSRRHP